MAAPGWYPDASTPGSMRWWDGTQWTEHTMAVAPPTRPPSPPPHQAAPVPPPPSPRLRPDGSLKGPSFRSAMAVLVPGVLLLVASMVVVVPAVIDSLDGPRFDTPGSRSVDLAEGAWVLYERTGRTRGSGGLSFETSRAVSISPQDVSVDGPAPVEIRSGLRGPTETITRGSTTYTAAVRLEIGSPGEYRITVNGVREGEVLVARPVTDLFSNWPWMVALAVGGVAVVAGLVMWAVGAVNRRTARRAGMLIS